MWGKHPVVILITNHRLLLLDVFISGEISKHRQFEIAGVLTFAACTGKMYYFLSIM